MQVSKVGVVAAGALATVAVMGSAAAGAPAQVAQAARLDAAQATLTTLGIGKALGTKQGGATDQARPLISIGQGSSIKALPWQICGSEAVAGVGITATASDPNTVIGDCVNGNVWLKQDNGPRGIISILDDASLNLLPWQACGSNVVAGLGLTATVNSPSTVTGDCHNANTVISAPDDNSATGTSLISLLSGSAVNVVPAQACGSSVVLGVGAVVPVNSPTTVLGDCTNAVTVVEPNPDGAMLPLLSDMPLNLLPLQFCETNGVASLVGLVVPLNSPAYVGGTCTGGGLLGGL